MRRTFIVTVALLVLISGVNAAPALRDIKGSWAETSIEEMTAAGILNGYPDGTFRPENPITRAEFSKVLVEALGLKEKAGNPFPDAKGHWAEAYIAAIADAKIVEGYEDGKFRPNNNITRAEVVTVLARALKLADEAEPADVWLPSFIDVPTDHWAYKAVEIANHLGLLPEEQITTQFLPRQKTTRAEAAYFVNAMRQLETLEGSVTDKDSEANLLTVRPQKGEDRLFYITTDTVIIRNNVAADLSKIQNGDKLYLLSNQLGDPLLVKAFGLVTKNDVAARISSMTQGLLTPTSVMQAMQGDWSAISNNMRSTVYNYLIDGGLTASEAESLVMQDWGSLKGEGQKRITEALAGQLAVSPQLVEALMAQDWQQLQTFAQIELTQRALGYLFQ